MRGRVFIAGCAVAVLVAVGLFQLSFAYFQSREAPEAEGRLSLYRSTVSAELARFSHLTYVLSRDPFVIATAEGAATRTLDVRLRDFAGRAGLDAIYLMEPGGRTISASNAGDAGSFVGQNYGFRPYVQDALRGEQGRFYGIGATTGLPGYFIADAVLAEDGALSGVIAIKIDLSKLQDSWRDAGEQVLLVNEDGVVLLASEEGWRYRTLTPLSAAQRAEIAEARQFPGQALEALDWTAEGGRRAQIGGSTRLHLVAEDLPHGWQLHYFAGNDRAVALSWLVTAAALVLAGVALVIYQVQRGRRVEAALRRSEGEEALLREANERLAIEIEDRRTAERRLKRTQGELERAGRLAALGQLSASVTHELGQPIAAMRNHIAAAEIGGTAPGGLTGRLSSLVDRMEGITRQLKFFARSGSEDFDEVDLNAAMETALTLLAPNIAATGAQVSFDPGAGGVPVRGNRLRLEQVMTNIVRNALDAVEDAPGREVSITTGEAGGTAWFEVRDTGHGLGDAELDDLQEPFVTTRESGRGMGLGLAISAGIVRDHGGEMSARNRDRGGAAFRVTFPAARADRAEDAA